MPSPVPFHQRIKAALQRRQAASKMEYAMLIGVVAVGALAAVSYSGTEIRGLFSVSNASLDGSYTPPTPTPPTIPGGEAAGAAKLSWSGDLQPLKGQPGQRATSTLQLQNVGNKASAPLSQANFSVEGIGFSVVSTTCNGPLAPNAQCNVEIAYLPISNDQTSGQVRYTVGSQTDIWPMQGEGENFVAALAWSGAHQTTVSAPQNHHVFALRLTNEGSAASAPVSVSSASWPVDQNTCSAILQPGGSCDFSVRFANTTNGTYANTITVANGPSLALEAIVSGYDPAWSWDAADTAFAADGTHPVLKRRFSLTNTGYGPGTPSITLSGDPAFTLSSTCTSVVAPGATCEVEVTFTADDNIPAPKTATLSIGSTQLALSGTADGFAAAWAWENPTVSFNATFDQPSTTQRLTLENVGTLSGTPGTPVLSGQSVVQYTVMGNTCDTVIAPDQNCTVDVRYTAQDNASQHLAEITLGGQSATLSGSATGWDRTPNAATFTALTNHALSTQATSESIVLTGYNTATNLSISGPGNPQFSINNGVWTNTGTISPGQSLRVRLTSSANDNTASAATISMNGAQAIFTVTTGQASPVAFTIPSKTNVAFSSVVVSDVITPTGNTLPTSISMTNGQLSLDGGTTWVASGTLQPNASFQARLTASANGNTATTGTVSVGGRTAIFTATTQATDSTPDTFAFSSVSGVAGNVQVTSTTITPTGYNSPAVVSITGDGSPQFSINGGTWRNTNTTISPGQTLAVRFTTGAQDGSTQSAVLSIDGVSASFSVQTIDTIPAAFAIPAKTNQGFGQSITSDPVTISGIDTATAISVSAGGQISLNDGTSWTNTATTIAPNGRFLVRANSSAAGNTTTNTTVTIGGVSSVFAITTQAAITTADTFSFSPSSVVATNSGTDATSNTITPTGFNIGIPVSISSPTAASFSINGGAFSATSRNILPGQTLAVRVASPGVADGSSSTGTVSLGGKTATFSVSSPDRIPDAYSIPTANNAPLNTLVVSNPVTITGISTPVAIEASKGDFSLDNGTTWVTTGTISAGGTFLARGMSSTEPNSNTTSAVISVGNVARAFQITTGAITPDAFTIAGKNDVPFAQYAVSDLITFTGNTIAAPVSVSNGQISINNGTTWTTSASVPAGQSFRVRVMAASAGATNATATVTAGGGGLTRSAQFIARTEATDTTPTAFTLQESTNVESSTQVLSEILTPTGYNTATSIKVVGAEMSINNGAWTAADSTISPGQTVQLRMTSSANVYTAKDATLTIGGVSTTWHTQTKGRYMVSGTVPAQAGYAILSFRLNEEIGGVNPGSSNLNVLRMVYAENGTANTTINMAGQNSGWWGGNNGQRTATTQGTDAVMNLMVIPTTKISANFPQMPTVTPGASFQFYVDANMISTSGNGAYAMIAFARGTPGGAYSEVTRMHLQLKLVP